MTISPNLDPLSEDQSTLTAPREGQPTRPSYAGQDVDMIGRYDPNRPSNGMEEDDIMASQNGLFGQNGHQHSSSAVV